MNRLEDDLRATLRRHAVDVDLAGGMPKEVRRRAHVRRAATAGLAGALAVAVVAAGIGVIRTMQPEPRPQPAPPTRLPLVERVPVTPRSAGDLTYPFDGALLRRAPDGTTTTWVTRSALNEVCGSRDCSLTELEWSPDGSELAIVMGVVRRTSPSRFAVYIVADDASVPRKLYDCPESMCAGLEGPSVSWSPDGSSMAVSGGVAGADVGLVVVDATEPASTEPRTVCGECHAASAVWSPDGRWLAYASVGGIRRISSEGGSSEEVDSSTSTVQSLSWSPEGTRLLVGSENAVRVLDLSRRPYSEDKIVGLQQSEGPAAPAWAPSGARLSWFATPGPHPRFVAEVWTARGNGSRPARLLRSGCCVSDWSGPLWSPDGRLIALGLSLDPQQPPDLLVLDAAHGTELARVPGAGFGPMAWQGLP